MRYYRISCKCPKKKDRRGASNWLGSIPLDYPTTAIHHCKVCNTSWMHRVDEVGTVYRTEIKKQIRHEDNIAVIDLE